MALAVTKWTGNLEKFCGEVKVSGDISITEGNNYREFVHIQGLRGKILNQVRNLAAEAGGKGSAKKDLNSQRNSFRDILESLETKLLSRSEHHISALEKRMYKSPNSVLNKARTQLLNKQRMLSQDKNTGHYAVGFGDEEI
ncbi:unnamed protein product [Ilex paraguariensis]|uniref:Interferon-related developmental regulator N-terminal domain-containing protein n=1 Tax=Ilex paraguariensis TaxID=185542 RepID=A0ABC8SE24_9AQUA